MIASRWVGALVFGLSLGWWWQIVPAAVFGGDDRTPYHQTSVTEKVGVLDATGGIVCFDGVWSTGFVVDVSHYVMGSIDFQVIATSAHALYDGESGGSRGRCAFVPAVSPTTYWEIGDRLVGAVRLNPADSNDWAFARIEPRSREFPSVQIAFEDLYDFDPSLEVELWHVGFESRWDEVALVRGCTPDDKSRYPSLLKQRDALAHMVIHDCDAMSSASGGPLLLSAFGVTQVIAVNAGAPGVKDRARYGVPYDPKRLFHNYSRRFDSELEQKLIAFISRYAHVKQPPPTIAARSELIRKVQESLTRLGFDPGPADGLIGSMTREAIQAFQTTLGITPTGLVSEELLLLLEAS